MRFRSSPSPTSEDPPLRPRLPGHWCTCRCRDPGQLAALPPCPSRFRAKQSAGKITRLPGATGADRPKPNRTEPNPNRPPTPPPRAGSLSPPTAPKAQPLAPSLPLVGGVLSRSGSSAGLFASRLGARRAPSHAEGCVEAPTVCAPRRRKRAEVFEGKGDTGFCFPPSPYGGCFLRRC